MTSLRDRHAIVALGCQFPEAGDVAGLWRNVLDGRRSFRVLPRSRLDLARYAQERVGTSDAIVDVRAGLISGWRFDPASYRIPVRTYEAADLAHWLALDVATRMLNDGGVLDHLDRGRTAVVVANTLTGEFSRAATLRTRLPFLEDTLLAEALRDGIEPIAANRLVSRFRQAVRTRIAAPNEETLAGGLSNTIAGRIANYLDLRGGAYTVDAACASSLVAIADAVSLLETGSAGAVLVGAVDLSLDPFELVGFSRAGALANGEMKVFDATSGGFWPGEGAAFALLVPEPTARDRRLPVHAFIRGCGISSDGHGGLTRPSVEGQHLALARASEAAKIDPADIGYVEAHGTGTAVGDPVEIRALARLRSGATRALPVGSIKANIGHTKAAAGFAGLIKAVCAVKEGIVPPHVGCANPHPVFRETGHVVRPALKPEAWPEIGRRIAGVSAFGFGGINAHVIVEQPTPGVSRASVPTAPVHQDGELFLFSGPDPDTVLNAIRSLLPRASSLSMGELADAAHECVLKVTHDLVRVAIVARSAEALASGLAIAEGLVVQRNEQLNPDADVFVSLCARQPRIGLLFPGQGAPVRTTGGAWARWEAGVDLPEGRLGASTGQDTATAQPAIVCASMSALDVLERCGIRAEVAVGHSLGEISAWAWADALDRSAAIALATARGSAMSTHGAPDGGMLRLEASSDVVQQLMHGLDVVIACDNAPDEIVISGNRAGLAEVQRRAQSAEIRQTPLGVSHAFHSPAMASARQAFAASLRDVRLGAPGTNVVSTIKGGPLGASDDLPALLLAQLTEPVRFREALKEVAGLVDFAIEVGPGTGLTRLARKAGISAIAVDAYAESIFPLLRTIAFAFTKGAPADAKPLFDGRPVRAIDLSAPPMLLVSPCGAIGDESSPRVVASTNTESDRGPTEPEPSRAEGALTAVLAAVAEETGLPIASIRLADRLLSDLHLNSIAVARISARVAAALGARAPRLATEFSNASVKEFAAFLEETAADTRPAAEGQVEGVTPWVRTYAVQWRPALPLSASPVPISWTRVETVSSAVDSKAPPERAGALIRISTPGPHDWPLELVRACQKVARSGRYRHLAICHAGHPISGFGRSLWLEGLFSSVTLIDCNDEDGMEDRLPTELAASLAGYQEIRLERDGGRQTPILRPSPVATGDRPLIGQSDVILFTGGAKGIGAECAVRLAEKSGCSLILVGRTPASDMEVARTLKRLRSIGAKHSYVEADVSDPVRLAEGVSAAYATLGPVTILIHGAASNDPAAFLSLGEEALKRALSPKAQGFLASVDAAGPSLQRVITLGSIINRFGLEGEAHYALANGLLGSLARQLRPRIQVLNLEWSVWSGAGMAERLGVIEKLARRNVAAISLDDALDMFERLAMGAAEGDWVVTGRFGDAHRERGRDGDADSLPALRFVDEPLVFYDGVELIVETEVHAGRDPYLLDHRPGGIPVFPAVMGMEAMAQVAMALTSHSRPAAFENVGFHRAILIPDGARVRLRVAGLADEHGSVRVVIRASDDDFSDDRMSARITFEAPIVTSAVRSATRAEGSRFGAESLYGSLLFHEGRFRRLSFIKKLTARSIAADVRTDVYTRWFSSFKPQSLCLGDPGARDAAIHAVQACVPHKRVLPIAAGRVLMCTSGQVDRVEAIERRVDGDAFVFDIDLRDAEGQLVERWEAAEFLAVEQIDCDAALAMVPRLGAPYVERVAREILRDDSINVSIVQDARESREERREHALEELGLAGKTAYRSDGRLAVNRPMDGKFVSVSHSGDMTLVATARCEIGCDLERIDSMNASSLLPDLFPRGWLVAARRSLDLSAEAEILTLARLWTLRESARKLGIGTQPQLRVESTTGARPQGLALAAFRIGKMQSVTIPLAIAGRTMVISVGIVVRDGFVKVSADASY